MTKRYAGAVGSVLLEGLSTAGWVAAGGLSPGKRRLVRTGVVGAGVAYGILAGLRLDSKEPAAMPVLSDKPIAIKDWDRHKVETGTPGRSDDGPDRKVTAGTVAAIALSAGLMVGRRQVEKRWLAGLVRRGHAHPHRALAIRMGLLAMAGALPSRLIRARQTENGTPAEPR